jgi:uncharacterized protein
MSPASSAAGPARVVLITGASAGLGVALALELVRQGKAGALVLAARRADRLDQVAAEIQSFRPDVQVLKVPGDLAEPATPGQLASEALSRFGGIDVLINNAGLGLPTLFGDAPPGQLARQIAVNFTAPLMLARLCLPSLIERQGMIINIGSAITCVANPALGAYGATKAGLAYWNDALRRELHSTGVRVCLVEPGPIKTDFMDALSGLLPTSARHAPILDNAAPWMTAEVDDVARRVVRLIDQPRRRLSVLRRLVWQLRVIGAVCQLCPPLGDRFVARLQGGPSERAARPG